MSWAPLPYIFPSRIVPSKAGWVQRLSVAGTTSVWQQRSREVREGSKPGLYRICLVDQNHDHDDHDDHDDLNTSLRCPTS